MSGRISALKNKISKLQIKIIALGSTLSAEHVKAQEKEIIELKQEGQCKQLIIDSLEYQLDRSNKALKDAYENIVRMNCLLKDIENKKIKNRLRKLIFG